jgi:MoaF C-terminal domain/MoaF N-terminal domain
LDFAVQRTLVDYEDTSTWPALNELRTGRRGYRPERSGELDGREFALTSAASHVSYRFGTDAGVEWTTSPGAVPGRRKRGRADVFGVAGGLYVAHVVGRPDGRAARTVVLDLARSRAVEVVSTIRRTRGKTAISQEFAVATIDGSPPLGKAPSATGELVGRRVRYDYGDGAVYEHLYLTPHLFTWLCLAGAERGLADTEVCTAYRVRRGIYLFSWREKVVPCAATVLIDLGRSRTCGSFVGLDSSKLPLFFTWGARATKLPRVRYPAALTPSSGAIPGSEPLTKH